MASRSGSEISLPLRVVSLPGCPDGFSTLVCLNCKRPLDIHQPDCEFPDRMLATCPTCRSWHLIDCGAGAVDAVIVLLPDPVRIPRERRPAESVPGLRFSGGRDDPLRGPG